MVKKFARRKSQPVEENSPCRKYAILLTLVGIAAFCGNQLLIEESIPSSSEASAGPSDGPHVVRQRLHRHHLALPYLTPAEVAKAEEAEAEAAQSERAEEGRRNLRLAFFGDPKTVELKDAAAANDGDVAYRNNGDGGSFHALTAPSSHRPPPNPDGRYQKVLDGVEPNAVLPGDYHIPQGSGSLIAMKDAKADTLRGSDSELPEYGRVLLFITSHFSKQHEIYLKYCWKNLLESSPLLNNADVAVFLNPNEIMRRKTAVDVFMDVFGNNDLKIYLRDPSSAMEGQDKSDEGLEEKRAGAHMAVHEAVENGYFEGYDWIIRVNPDVLLKDDSFFRKTMSDSAIWALFVNCHQADRTNRIQLHTDFFAVRPKVLDLEFEPKEMVHNSAELTFTAWMWKTVFEKDPSTPGVLNEDPSNLKWVPGAHPTNGKTCRVGYEARPKDTPILHDHRVHLDMCTVPPSELLNVKRAFKRRVGIFSRE